jgi:hypothetical protein
MTPSRARRSGISGSLAGRDIERRGLWGGLRFFLAIVLFLSPCSGAAIDRVP